MVGLLSLLRWTLTLLSPLSCSTWSVVANVASSEARPRCGMLCVGLAGNNGVTLVAAQLANRCGLTWESDRRGPQEANLLGCITQVGKLARRHHGLASFSDMAVGGWDIRPLPLGQGLYESRVLDYDLVRQVRDEMDATRVLPGVWDASFIGDSQHAGATNTAPPAPKPELLRRLRADIRAWREAEQVRHLPIAGRAESTNQNRGVRISENVISAERI